jgi:hypothetical protein
LWLARGEPARGSRDLLALGSVLITIQPVGSVLLGIAIFDSRRLAPFG